MSEWLLRATIREVRVEYNGTDLPGTLPPEEGDDHWNVIVAVLAYPRSGAAVVTSLRELNLPSASSFDDFGENPTFFDNGLFKEVVQGETALRINVSDRERRNALVRFVRRALGGGLGALLRGNRGRMLGGMVGNLTKALSDAIEGSDVRIRNLTVGNTARAQIFIAADGTISVPNAGASDEGSILFSDGLLRLELIAPRDFSHTILDAEHRGGRPRTKENLIVARGQSNGHVVLKLEALPRVAVQDQGAAPTGSSAARASGATDGTTAPSRSL